MILSGRAKNKYVYIYIYIYVYIYLYSKAIYLRFSFMFSYICVWILDDGVLNSSLMDKGTIGQPP